MAWLAAVQRRLVEDDAPEPCDVSQLPALASGTRALANFLGVSPALLKMAYQPAQRKLRIDDSEELVKWVRSLPPKQKDEYLARFIGEPANVVRSKLLKQYRASQAKGAIDASTYARRMVTRLLSSLEPGE